tara:strand:- start:479 stop:772 length:294 start_codon:yes stop_codon:yes gene_type:complete
MSREDYEAISKIIEEVVGRDTLTGVKLLEGIRFYINNKVEKVYIVKDEESVSINTRTIKNLITDSKKAMKRYTAKLKKENEQYRKKKSKTETCSITG